MKLRNILLLTLKLLGCCTVTCHWIISTSEGQGIIDDVEGATGMAVFDGTPGLLSLSGGPAKRALAAGWQLLSLAGKVASLRLLALQKDEAAREEADGIQHDEHGTLSLNSRNGEARESFELKETAGLAMLVLVLMFGPRDLFRGWPWKSRLSVGALTGVAADEDGEGGAPPGNTFDEEEGDIPTVASLYDIHHWGEDCGEVEKSACRSAVSILKLARMLGNWKILSRVNPRNGEKPLWWRTLENDKGRTLAQLSSRQSELREEIVNWQIMVLLLNERTNAPSRYSVDFKFIGRAAGLPDEQIRLENTLLAPSPVETALDTARHDAKPKAKAFEFPGSNTLTAREMPRTMTILVAAVMMMAAVAILFRGTDIYE